MTCDAHRDDLLDVLYGEADPAATRRVEDHLARCPDCRDELDSLRGLRGDLARWEVPASLRTPRAPASPVLRGAWWRPALAAATVVLALGATLGLSGSELRYDAGRVSFRLGRGPATPPPDPALREVESRLRALEARHQETLRTLQAALASRHDRDTADPLPNVERLIADSEARQTLLLEARLEDYADRADRQRRSDLAQVSAGLSYLDGKTGLQVARTTELVGQVLQASQKR
jgi:anti-sigma factor RsiW